MHKSAAIADPIDTAALAVVEALDGRLGGSRRLPAAPRHLSPEARAWWREIVAAFDVPVHHLANLEGAATALDRAAACRRLLDAEGVVTADRFGQPKEHPAAQAERGYLVVHARLLRELGLDLSPVATPRMPTRWRPR